MVLTSIYKGAMIILIKLVAYKIERRLNELSCTLSLSTRGVFRAHVSTLIREHKMSGFAAVLRDPIPKCMGRALKEGEREFLLKLSTHPRDSEPSLKRAAEQFNRHTGFTFFWHQMPELLRAAGKSARKAEGNDGKKSPKPIFRRDAPSALLHSIR